MGNGPSLGKIDLLKDTIGYDTFGMNAAYRYWERIDWWPTYYSCLDIVVGESHFEAIQALVLNSTSNGIDRFLLRKSIADQIPRDFLGYVDCYEDLVERGLLPNLPDITTGSHTLLWARYLGYQTILIAGVDLDYVEQIDQSSLIDDVLEINSAGENPNYFFDDYQRPGDRYNIPNPRPNLHKGSWVNASRHIHFPLVVVNLNADSALTVFVKNQPASMSTVGPFLHQTDNDLIGQLEKLNKQKHKAESIHEFVETRIQSLCERDKWCRALVSDESTDPNAIALVFDTELTTFRLLTVDEMLQGLAKKDRVIIATPDRRLLCEILVALHQMATPPVLQNAKTIMFGIQEKLLRLTPRRLRQISFYENWLDIFSYYRSIRGMVILVLNGGLAYLIGLPNLDLTTIIVAWGLLSLLLPLTQRR